MGLEHSCWWFWYVCLAVCLCVCLSAWRSSIRRVRTSSSASGGRTSVAAVAGATVQQSSCSVAMSSGHSSRSCMCYQEGNASAFSRKTTKAGTFQKTEGSKPPVIGPFPPMEGQLGSEGERKKERERKKNKERTHLSLYASRHTAGIVTRSTFSEAKQASRQRL